jgi:hypothetical protein
MIQMKERRRAGRAAVLSKGLSVFSTSKRSDWVRARSCLAGCALAGLAMCSTSQAFLPDGRVYEQVSPGNKNGNVVGNPFSEKNNAGSFGLAAENGNSVLFVGSGAMGTAYAGLVSDFVAHRTAAGWSTAAVASRLLHAINIIVTESPNALVPSAGFDRFLYTAYGDYSSREPLNELSSVNVYLGEDPAVEPAWLGAPQSADAIPAPGHNALAHDYLLVGGDPSLNRIEFTYSGTLLAQDQPRAANVGTGEGTFTGPWGYYEWTGGELVYAGILPDGSLSAFGAVPATMAGGSASERYSADYQAATLANESSSDGTTSFFVSPDPLASSVTNSARCALEGPCTNNPPELYVRQVTPDGSARTQLVSQSQLPRHEPEAPAPLGVASVPETITHGMPRVSTDDYASPDGSRVFFASQDRLTEAAPEDSSTKEYEFDVKSGVLTYLPDLVGSIAAVSRDGSRVLFEDTTTAPASLDLWSDGPGGGSVQTVAHLPVEAGEVDISGTRATADGTVFVFRTNAAVPGFNNAGGYEQVYRYDMTNNEITCVSCPPAGVVPTGDAEVSYDDRSEGRKPNGFQSEPMSIMDTRIVSDDGQRVFFDTPDPLVPQDINSARDVYEWESGAEHMLSSGTGTTNTYIVDASLAGEDVFMATDVGLVPGDVDGAYDVYDARVPRSTDVLILSTAECEGQPCHGDPPSPLVSTLPASVSVLGNGNIQAAVPTRTSPKPHHKPKCTGKKRRKRSCKTRPSHKRRASLGDRGSARHATRPPRHPRATTVKGRG